MITAQTIHQVRRAVEDARRSRQRIGFVPTMGALHEGHLSLIDAAAEECEFVVVSIFVNPTQFGPGEDLDAYPRTLAADEAACRDRGVDLVFAPPVEQMYPAGVPLTSIRVERMTESLCGASRAGHFDGVCTVVAKLLNIVGPDRAYFGLKDYQQYRVICRMVEDLNIPVRIVGCPTVREPDGLAMSSRNAYLSEAHRVQAAGLHQALLKGRQVIRAGQADPGAILAEVAGELAERVPDGQAEYVRIVDPETLADVSTVDGPVVIALAVGLGGARLIDNIRVDAAGASS